MILKAYSTGTVAWLQFGLKDQGFFLLELYIALPSFTIFF